MWTGQCLACDGIETLETSWLLRSFVDSCIDKWKSTRIGGSCDSFGGFLSLHCTILPIVGYVYYCL